MTIEVPTPTNDLIAQVETATIQSAETEAQALAAIREKFAPYAKHNGTIKTGYYHRFHAGQRIDVTREAYYTRNGRSVRALRIRDLFEDDRDGQNSGSKIGFRLYLTEYGEWLELERRGQWSQWEGAANYWYTDIDSVLEIGLGDDDTEPATGGHVRIMTDAEVSDEYTLERVLEGLSASMDELCKKLPERFTRLTARAELAKRALEALK